MEYPNSVEFKVGIFVAVATVLSVSFILALGGDKTFLSRSDFIHMNLDEAHGLFVGSQVQISGIPAGNVSKIDFLPDSNHIDVTLKIERAFMKKLTQGSAASIHTQGALGDKYVSIVPGPTTGALLKSGDFIEVETDTDLLSTLGKSGNRIERVFDILDDLKKLLGGLNERHFSQNLADTARNSKNATTSLDELLASVKGNDPKNNKVKRMFDHLESIFEKIDKGQGTLGGLINDPTVHEDLKEIMGGAKRSKILKYLIRQAVQSNEDAESKSKKH